MRATGGRRAAGLVHAVLSRRQPVPSTGVPMTWVTALDRFARGVHRYHDRVEVIPDRLLRRELQEAAAQLEEALAAARAAGRVREGREARDAAGAEGARAVRDLLRAGTLCSRATEAAVAAAAARRAGDAEASAQALSQVRTLTGLVAELIERPPAG